MSHVDIKHNPQPSGHVLKKNKTKQKKKKRNNSGLGVGKWSESEKMSGHAILKNLYEKKMDVILKNNSGNGDKKTHVLRST